MSAYLNRKAQTEYLRNRGVDIGDSGLANLASNGKGPKFAILNGRAVSTKEWLDAWVQEQASITPSRRRTKLAAAEVAS